MMSPSQMQEAADQIAIELAQFMTTGRRDHAAARQFVQDRAMQVPGVTPAEFPAFVAEILEAMLRLGASAAPTGGRSN